MKQLLLILGLGLVFTGFTQPSNDDCGAAYSTVIGSPISFNTTGATNNGPQVEGGEIYHDIWFYFTASSAERFNVSTCNSSFNTRLAVYESTSCANITSESHISFNIYSTQCDGAQNSALFFDASPGQTYYIRVGSSANIYGSGELLVTSSPIPPVPPNDLCANAITLNIIDYGSVCQNTTPFTTEGSSSEVANYNCVGENFNTVWFKFTTDTNQEAIRIVINVTGSNGVILEFVEDCSGTPAPIYDYCYYDSGSYEYVLNEFLPNTTYYIKAGSSIQYGVPEGSFGICLQAVLPVNNDDCDSSQNLTLNVAESFDNSGAKSNTLFSTYGGMIQRDLWYRFTPNYTLTYDVSTCGSNFDTRFAIFEASDCSLIDHFTDIAGSDNDITCLFNEYNSFAQFIGQAGTRYYIQVGSHDRYIYGPGQIVVSHSQAGVNEQILENFKMYPNPASESVELIFQNVETKVVRILDHSGRLLLTLKTEKINENINLVHFESGVYFIEVNESKRKSIQRLVKK